MIVVDKSMLDINGRATVFHSGRDSIKEKFLLIGEEHFTVSQ